MTTNPELAASLATVPEIERTKRLLDDATTRLREHPQGAVPDAARNAVIDGAVATFQSKGTWPADIGKQAAKAYDEAAAWEAERIARTRAKESTELLAYDTRLTYSADALEHLGTRLGEALSDAREAVETLGDVRSADAAIKAGGAVVEAWGRLQGLVDDVANIRAAQWELLLPRLRPGDPVASFDEDRRKVRGWKNEGFGEVRGSLDGVPAFVREATRSGRYSETVLLWLAGVETTYVPTSFEDLQDDAGAGDLVDVFEGADGPIVDYTPRETPAPAGRPSDVYAHTRTPNLDNTKPRPAPPKPNATVADPKPTDYSY